MKVKTFHALTMQDAIRAIKEELGPDAIILSSKEVRQGGRLLRLFNRPILEVMAAAEHDVGRMAPEPPQPAARVAPPQTAPVPDAPAAYPARDFQETLQAILSPDPNRPADGSRPDAALKAPPNRRPADLKRHRLARLRAELSELSRALGESLPPETQSLGAHLPGEIATLCRLLIGQGVRPSTAEALGGELVRSMTKTQGLDSEEIRHTLGLHIAKRVRVSGPLLAAQGDRTVSLLLGPSGAGKTSVVTKLAAHYRLEEKKSVAIVTFDTYREAAIEQLRMYANVLGVPFASALSPRQVRDGLRRHTRADLVLIDMPGIGQHEVAAAGELHRLLRDESEVDTHLVLPAAMRESDLLRIVERAKELPLLRLLFTKLDETASFGTIFELAYQTGVPLSYWTAGQRVPEDIELATADRLSTFLFTQRYVPPPAPLQHLSTQPRSSESTVALGALSGPQKQ
jgi:flagellar biosynthesis protein FlhF